MAASKKSESKNEEAQEFIAPPDMPTGDDWVDAGTVNVDGWWKPSVGSIVAGQLIKRLTIADQNNGMSRDVVLIRLSHDTTDAMINQNEVMLRKGQIIGVGVRYDLQEMLEYVEHQGYAWVKATEKISIGGGKSKWNFEAKYRGKRSAPPQAMAQSGDTDDIPF
jgi:hypothetical protein